MDFRMITGKQVAAFLKKWHLPILLAVVGIAILLFPGAKQEDAEVDDTRIQTWISPEQKMEEILSHVAGAGSVRVMLTLKNDGHTEYQTDEEYFTDDGREEKRTETVFRSDDALVRYKTYPEYLGAVVLCQGGDDPKVCLKLIDAVCSLTGLTSDKITVLKMK